MQFSMKFRRIILVAAVFLPIGPQTALAQHVTYYDYDAQGQLTRVNGPGSADRRFVFDDSGNRLIARSATNSAPVAGVDIIGMTKGDPTLVFNLLANDSDGNGHPLKVTRIFNVQFNGSGSAANINLRSDGRVNVSPGDAGSTTFSYTVTDLEAETTGTGSVEVIDDGGLGGGGCQFFC